MWSGETTLFWDLHLASRGSQRRVSYNGKNVSRVRICSGDGRTVGDHYVIANRLKYQHGYPVLKRNHFILLQWSPPWGAPGLLQNGAFPGVEMEAASLEREWIFWGLRGGFADLPYFCGGEGCVYLTATFFPEGVCTLPFSDFCGRIGHLVSDLCQTVYTHGRGRSLSVKTSGLNLQSDCADPGHWTT